MDGSSATAVLKHLGFENAEHVISELDESSSSQLRSSSGSSVTLLRKGENFDIVVLGVQSDCPVPSLRAVLETAVLPLSEDYAARIGVALPERDALRKRIREASVALDVIAKGRLFSVSPPQIPLNNQIKKHVENGAKSIKHLPDDFVQDLAILNQLQANVVMWSKEIDRIVEISRVGPGTVLTAEEETVFWSSLDAALSAAQQALSSVPVKISLEILARKRRATGFLFDANNSLDAGRRKAAGVLTLIQGLPIVALRTAEDLESLRNGVVTLLEHIGGKLRMSSFSVGRVLSLIDALGTEVNHSIGRILTAKGSLLSLPYLKFVEMFESCCELFEAWSQGYDYCRKVARESARKKGETMPPRVRSPLSKLYMHLTEVYELRANHQAIRTVLVELSTEGKQSTFLQTLDYGLGHFTEECKNLNHFDLCNDEKDAWAKAQSQYRSDISCVEENIANKYTEVFNQRHDLQSLASALNPFEGVLEKTFMSQATADAIGSVLKLGLADLNILKERERRMSTDANDASANVVPDICIKLSESRLLRSRMSILLKRLEQVSGKTHMSVTPDLRDFVAEVQRFKGFVDPSKYLNEWLNSIDMSAFKSRVLAVNLSSDGQPHLSCSIEKDIVWFFRVIRLAREGQDTSDLLSSQHLEFARKTKCIIPLYSKIEEAIDSFNLAAESLMNIDAMKRMRIMPFVKDRWSDAQEHIQDGFTIQWDSYTSKLQTFASELYESCSSLWSNLQAMLDTDEAIENCLNELQGLRPTFQGSALSEDTKNRIEGILKCLAAEQKILQQTLGDAIANEYYTKFWISRINAALISVIRKLTTFWVSSLRDGRTDVPKLLFDAVPDSEGTLQLSLRPSIEDTELFLFLSLGDTYQWFVDSMHAILESQTLLRANSSSAWSVILLLFFRHEINIGIKPGLLSTLQPIDEAVTDLSERAVAWSKFVGILRTKIPQVNPSSQDCRDEPARTLRFVSEVFEDVRMLRDESESERRRPVTIDSRALGNKMLSTVRNTLSLYCNHIAKQAADESQRTYKRISDTIAILNASLSDDGGNALVSLQNVKEDVIPSSQSIVEKLMELESLFDSIAKSAMDPSLAKAESTDTWVLSDTLTAHLQCLVDLHERRSAVLMANREFLTAKYAKSKEEFQLKLASLFRDFQNIRGEDAVQESFIDSEHLLLDLEHQLQSLNEQARNVETMGRALGKPSTAEYSGPREILVEVQKVRNGLTQLGALGEELKALAETEFGNVDPETTCKRLSVLLEEAQRIGLSSGAKREAHRHVESIKSYLKGTDIVSGLCAIKLSPPREREIIQKLFGDVNLKEGGIAKLPLLKFWSADLESHQAYIKTVLQSAAGEASICDFLSGIESQWVGRKGHFSIQDGMPILQDIPQLLDDLEENLQALNTMSGSEFARLFESERSNWENRLAKLRESLELLIDVQARWAHLRTLFGSQHNSSRLSIRGELQEEFAAFSNVQVRFSSFGEQIEAAPGILEGMERSQGLEDMANELQGVVRGLSRYLEQQRSRCPRFFFLSDDDLLQVLSVTASGIEGLLPHIGRLFPGISSFKYETNGNVAFVSEVTSKEGETLVFTDPVCISENTSVSSWLLNLECSIENTLRSTLPGAIEYLESLFAQCDTTVDSDFFSRYLKIPAQIGLLATRICFVRLVDSAFSTDGTCGPALQKLFLCVELLLNTVRTAKEDVGVKSNGRLSLVRGQLIKEFVYQRRLIKTLLSEGVADISSYQWDHELRPYCESENGSSVSYPVTFKCGSAIFQYGWEYLGVGDTLVHTSLTSKCFLTLSECLRRGFGGSPFGPAGTGKTETVKALGRALGRFVAVFNCDESFDSISVGRILAGACRLGCWICFDEFNRLTSSILSSTSGQLSSLQLAIRQGDKEVRNFFGGDLPIAIKPGVGVFVTMNPTYSGRQQLPTNLKNLFRPCAMSKPDIVPIAEVLLLTQGFNSSANLARKLVAFFHHLDAVLSAQPHYDFGLRSLKSTVMACGALIASPEYSDDCELQSNQTEENIVIRGIAEVLKPKLESSDISEYNGAIAAVFTQASCLNPTLPADVESAVQDVISENDIIPIDSFTEKVRQLFWLLQHQSGLILVGRTGSGKTAVWQTLFNALKRLAKKTGNDSNDDHLKGARSSVTVLDPKLLSTSQIYGHLDPVTREWSDGLFTGVLRDIAEEQNSLKSCRYPLHWIVFDGDVDPVWAENLNSVLDDNRILTLPSGEQLPFLPNTRIIMETDHLRHANPSTISRCGMICFGEPESIDEQLVSSLDKMLTTMCPSLSKIGCLPDLIGVITSTGRQSFTSEDCIMNVPFFSLLHSFLTLAHNCLKTLLRTRPRIEKVERFRMLNSAGTGDISKPLVLRMLLVCAVNAIGAGLFKSGRRKLSQSLLEKAGCLSEVQEALRGTAIPSDLSDVSVQSDGQFVDFSELVSSKTGFFSASEVGNPDIVIPTATTVRLSSLIRDVLNLESPTWDRVSCLILCGPPGCGKSMILTSALRDAANVFLSTISFSSETKPENVLSSLKVHTIVSKRPNGTFVLRPKSAGCRVVLFCDEVNLEKPDKYESQPCLSLLRSFVEHNGFWDGSLQRWVEIEGLQVVAACNPEGDAGRHKLPFRFLRHCNVVRVEQPNAADLKIIYGEFVTSLLKYMHEGLVTQAGSMTTAMVEFFIRNKNKFSPDGIGPRQPHYVYSPRELSRWVRGMSQLLVEEEDATTKHSSIGQIDMDSPSSLIWKDVIAAFCYEARRLFLDRLLTQEDKSFAEHALLDVAREHLQAEDAWVVDTLYSSWLESNSGKGTWKPRFRTVRNLVEFRSLIYQKLRVFAEEEGLGGSWLTGSTTASKDDATPMIDQFAVTDDVLTHVSRIERILSNPLGHAVLMGSPGTGKKTLTRFAAWMLSIEIHQVRSHSSYSEQDFANDLRKILRVAGVDGRRVVMIFDESHAMESGFLEMMNSLLACGEVPGLFSNEERTSLLDDLRVQTVIGTSATATETTLYSEFVRRVRNNLHIVFTFSSITDPQQQLTEVPVVSNDRDISKRSPALYNRCTVNWIGDWTADTLEAVAELKIEVSLGSEKDEMVRSAVQIHEYARSHYRLLRSATVVSPRHYLEFVEQLNRLALEKGGEIQGGVERNTEGLKRLKEAGVAIDNLKETLEEKTISLHRKEANANETLKKMVEEQRHAEKSKVSAEQLALAAAEASAAVRDREDEVSEQLADVLPKVEAAKDAVGSIRREYLEELRAMPNPPASVKLTMEGVLMVLDASEGKAGKSYAWGTIRGRMRGSEFISSVVNFDPESVPKELRRYIDKKVLRNPDFNASKIAYASRAAGPLAEWTLAVLEYAAVMESIEPLQAEVADLQEEQDELLEQQRIALEDVQQFETRIERCKEDYAKLVAEAEKVRQEIKESEENLVKSEQMLDSLADEWDRWIKDINSFNTAAVTVWGNALFAAAFLAYAGALDSVQRKKICSGWRDILLKEGIPFSDGFEICNFLTSAKERGIWSTAGLPTDATSLENYAMLKRSARYPLIVDPTRSISQLLQKIIGQPKGVDQGSSKGSQRRLSMSSFSSGSSGKKSYMRTLESAMRFGTAVLLEDSEKFDRAVAPLLGQESSYGDAAQYVESLSPYTAASKSEKRMSRNICRRVVRLGQKDVFLSPSFRMYMSTAQISDVPQAAVTRSNVVSFELSPEALGITCVTKAMEALSPELEEMRRSSVAVQVQYEERKLCLEEEVLSAVTKVDDLGAELLRGTLLEKLATLKDDVRIMQEKQDEEQKASAQIKERERHLQPLAQEAVTIFSVLQSLCHLHSLYIFDTGKFLKIFAKALQAVNSRKHSEDELLASQLSLLKKSFSETVSGLFPRDRLPFAASLSLITNLSDSSGGQVSSPEDVKSILSAWRKSLDGNKGTFTSINHKERGLCLNLLSPNLRIRIESNSGRDADSNISTSIQAALDVLDVSLQTPENLSKSIDGLACTLPESYELVHDEQHHPESALRSTISSFADSFRSPNPIAKGHPPLLLWARGGNSDPAALAGDIASGLQLSVVNLPMGAEVGSENIATTVLIATRKADNHRGIVVILKNMHLATKSAIEQLEVEVTSRAGHLPFLLILVAEVSAEMPANLLLGATTFFRVLAFQSLPSFRANFSQAADQISSLRGRKQNVSQPLKPILNKLQIFLAWFHACVLERAANSPVGFVKNYDFSDTDLLAAWNVIENEAAKLLVSLDHLQSVGNLLVTSCYGCRLEHDTDHDILNALVRDMFSVNRFRDSDENRVLVSGRGSEAGDVWVPLAASDRQKFVRQLSLEPNPQWCHMPSRTTLQKHAREGVAALTTTLKLCEMSMGADEVEKTVATGRSEGIQAEALLHLTTQMTPVRLIKCDGKEDALSRFWYTEGGMVNHLIENVKEDLRILCDSERHNKMGARLMRLRNELEQPAQTGENDLPSSWKELSPLIGRCRSIDDLFSMLSNTSQCVRRFVGAKNEKARTVNVSNILRPQALLSALRFQYAASSKHPVPSLKAVLGQNGDTESWKLSGIVVRGAKWDIGQACFVLCEDSSDADTFSLTWRHESEEGNDSGGGMYSLPVYRGELSRSILTTVLVPVSKSSSLEQWRLRGVSFSIE